MPEPPPESTPGHREDHSREPASSVPPVRPTAPLVWLLLLIGALAALWYLYARTDPALETPPLESAVPAVDQGVDQAVKDEAPLEESSAEDPTATPSSTTPAAPARPRPQDRDAEPATQVQPTYPAAALRVREEGTVLLRVEVDATGRPVSVEVQRSSRSRDLDRAARDAVQQWTFEPAIRDGRPASSTVTVPVDFSIGDP